MAAGRKVVIVTFGGGARATTKLHMPGSARTDGDGFPLPAAPPGETGPVKAWAQPDAASPSRLKRVFPSPGIAVE